MVQKSSEGAERSHSMLHTRPLTFLVNWLAESRAGKDAGDVSIAVLLLTFSSPLLSLLHFPGEDIARQRLSSRRYFDRD